jgi:hypothetical protein
VKCSVPKQNRPHESPAELSQLCMPDVKDSLVQGLMCYAVVMGFMFALSDLPEVTVAIAQPLVPALALGMSALLGLEALSYVSLLGIVLSIAGTFQCLANFCAGQCTWLLCLHGLTEKMSARCMLRNQKHPSNLAIFNPICV